MPPTILGLDIGGANLKAAAADRRAVSVPFPLWKNKDALPAALADLIAKFPDADQFAVTMTGELCDCYETKREGVAHILRSVRAAARGHPVRVWGTDGRFHTVDEAIENHLTVAAANWHALATFAGGYVPDGDAILIDIGSTTTDVIPIRDGVPNPKGLTDPGRLATGELVYTGVRRTPVCAVVSQRQVVAAELFATMLDVYVLLGMTAEDSTDVDTADDRPATRENAHARLSRMLGGDPETVSRAATEKLAHDAFEVQRSMIESGYREAAFRLDRNWRDFKDSGFWHLLSGSGEFLGEEVLKLFMVNPDRVVSLRRKLGRDLSACAPAYAVAVLASERLL